MSKSRIAESIMREYERKKRYEAKIQRHKTNDAYNLDLIDFENSTNDFWQMPVIQNDNFIPDDIIGFNYAKSSKEHNVGIYFYAEID